MGVLVPLGDALPRKVGEHLDGVDVAEDDQPAVGVAVADLLAGAWVLAWLAWMFAVR